MLAKTLEINWHDGQAIYSIDFSPDGARYATAGADNSVRVKQKKLSPHHPPNLIIFEIDLEYSKESKWNTSSIINY